MNDRTRGRARIGVVVPFSNTNLEPDLMMLCPPGVSLHFARAGGYDLDAVPDEHQMRRYSDAPFEEVVDSLRACRPDVMLYGCTSATLAQGPAFDAGFRRRIEERAGAPAVTAASAVIEALEDLGVERIAFSLALRLVAQRPRGVVHRGMRLPMRRPGRHCRSPSATPRWPRSPRKT